MMVRRGVKEDNLSQFCPAASFAKLTLFLFCVCDKYCQNFFGMHTKLCVLWEHAKNVVIFYAYIVDSTYYIPGNKASLIGL